MSFCTYYHIYEDGVMTVRKVCNNLHLQKVAVITTLVYLHALTMISLINEENDTALTPMCSSTWDDVPEQMKAPGWLYSKTRAFLKMKISCTSSMSWQGKVPLTRPCDYTKVAQCQWLGVLLPFPFILVLMAFGVGSSIQKEELHCKCCLKLVVI